VALLLRQHKTQGHGRMHGRSAFNGTNSAHNFAASKKRFYLPLLPEEIAFENVHSQKQLLQDTRDGFFLQ
jgi:hypothetical protein